MKLSIIIPVYNEEKTIDELLNKVINVNLIDNWKKEIIVVDDGSTDNTREILKKYKDRAKIIFKKKNEGKGSAIKEGFKYVTGDYILIQDADLEYNPKEYNKLLEPINNNEADIVIGVRKFKGLNIFYYGGIFLTKIFNIFFGSNFRDNATCYKLFPKKLIKDLIKYPQNNFVFDNVCLSYEIFKSGLRIKEIEIEYNPRKIGKKIKIKDGFEVLKIMFAIFSKTKKGEYFIKCLSILLIIVLYSSLVFNNINSQFIHISEDNNGCYGTSVINWIEKGVLNLKFGNYTTDLIRDKYDNKNFYTHHPSFFLIPTYIIYKIFGISEKTTRLGPFFVYLISLIIFYFSLTKIFKEEIYMPLFISLIFSILPSSIYYGKLLETAVFGVPFALITFSFFIFYLNNKTNLNFILFLISILIGGLTNWFFYFMPVSIWLYVLFSKNDFNKAEKRRLLFFIPIFVFSVFLFNIFHFYILKGSSFYSELKDVYKMRTGGSLSGELFFIWFKSILNRLDLNFTKFFLTLSFVGLFLFLKNFKKFKIFIPLLIFPLLILFVFKQWSTHPYGVIFFSPIISILVSTIFYEGFRKNFIFGLFLIILIFSCGYYFSEKRMNNFYNNLLILGPKDIEFLKFIKDKVKDYDVCEAKNDLGIGFDGIIRWYLRKNILFSPECINKSTIVLVGNPNLREFYLNETNKFLLNNYKIGGCFDFWCVLVK